MKAIVSYTIALILVAIVINVVGFLLLPYSNNGFKIFQAENSIAQNLKTCSSETCAATSVTAVSQTASQTTPQTTQGGNYYGLDQCNSQGCPTFVRCYQPQNDPIFVLGVSNSFDSCFLGVGMLFNLNPLWLKAETVQESGMDTRAISPDTPACGSKPWTHSYGLLQITPDCEGSYGIVSGSCIPYTSAWGTHVPESVDRVCDGQYVINTADPASSAYSSSTANPVFAIWLAASVLRQKITSDNSVNHWGTDICQNMVEQWYIAVASYNAGYGTIGSCSEYTKGYPANGDTYVRSILAKYSIYVSDTSPTFSNPYMNYPQADSTDPFYPGCDITANKC